MRVTNTRGARTSCWHERNGHGVARRGGEFLDALPGLPARTVATESWAPNVPIAARRLARRSIPVAQSQDVIDNALQADDEPDHLPFRDMAFDLVLTAPGRPAFDLDLLVGQVVRAGLTVEDARVATETIRFADADALAWYLRMIPRAVPGFDITIHRGALESAAGCELVVRQDRFLLNCGR